jgi:hypothetical protein
MEAIVAGVPVLSYEPFPYSEPFDYDVNRILTTVNTLEEVVDAAGTAPDVSLNYDRALFDNWFAGVDGRVAERLADLVEKAFGDYDRFKTRLSHDSLELRWLRLKRRWKTLRGRTGPTEPARDRIDEAVRSLSPAPLTEFLR